MASTMLKRVVVCAAFAVWMFGLVGCVKQSDFDAKVAEEKSQSEKAAKAEEKVLQLEKDLAAAKSDIEKAGQAKKDADEAKKDAEAKIETLEQANMGLKNRVKTLGQANAGLKVTVSQLQKDINAAKNEVKKAEKAKKDAETWEITVKDHVHTIKLVALPNHQFRLSPNNLAFHGVYQFDGKTLTMVAENRGYPDLVWSLKKPGSFEMVAGTYIGASMRRKAGDEEANTGHQ